MAIIPRLFFFAKSTHGDSFKKNAPSVFIPGARTSTADSLFEGGRFEKRKTSSAYRVDFNNNAKFVKIKNTEILVVAILLRDLQPVLFLVSVWLIFAPILARSRIKERRCNFERKRLFAAFPSLRKNILFCFVKCFLMFLGGVSEKKIYLDYFVVFFVWFVGGYIHAISPNSYNTNTEAKSPIARSSKATESENLKSMPHAERQRWKLAKTE